MRPAAELTHFGSRGSAGPPLHGRGGGDDGRRGRDGGGRARRPDQGELVPMSPKGSRHEAIKIVLVDRWIRSRPDNCWLAQETTFRLSEDTYLEPDIVIYPRASGVTGLSWNNVLLVVEIADSSLRYDIGRKAAPYASFGIRELWVIDTVRTTTRVFRHGGRLPRQPRFRPGGPARAADRAGRPSR